MTLTVRYDAATDLVSPTLERHVTNARSQMEDGFTRKEVSHHLTVVDPSFMTIESRHTYLLVAHRPSRFFQRRYEWTGSGGEGLPVVTSGIDKLGHRNHNLQGPVVQEEDDHGRILVVDLGRTVPKGDSETVQIEHTFVDTGQTFKPFMGHRAYVGCKKVTIAVSLPLGLNVFAEFETRKVGAKLPSSREPLTGIPEDEDLLQLVRFQKVVPQPVPDEWYSIMWTVN